MEVVRRSESIAALAKALTAAQGSMELARRDASNPYYRSTYADLASVVDAAKKPLSENGLSVVQTLIYCTLAGESRSQLCVLSELLHESGEWICGIYPLNPTKNDPQGLGSAVTYARRYAYQALVGIAPAGEDDDGNKASEKADSPAAKEAAKKSTDKPEAKPYQPPARDASYVSPIPENPWLWKIQGESIYKGKYVATLTDEVLKKLKKDKNRDDLHFKGLLTGLDMEALYECFRNLDARTEALSDIMDEEEAAKNKKEEDQTNE